MFSQKTKMGISVVLALLLAFILVGISYILFPDPTIEQPPIMPIPKIESSINQIFWAIQWIGLAAVIAISAVGALLLVSKIRSRKMSEEQD